MALRLPDQGFPIGIAAHGVAVADPARREITVAAFKLHQLAVSHHTLRQLLRGPANDLLGDLVHGHPVGVGLAEDVPDVPVQFFLAAAEKVIGRGVPRAIVQVLHDRESVFPGVR